MTISTAELKRIAEILHEWTLDMKQTGILEDEFNPESWQLNHLEKLMKSAIIRYHTPFLLKKIKEESKEIIILFSEKVILNEHLEELKEHYKKLEEQR